MKLHLPHSLRKALLCAFALAATLGTSNTYAGVLHSQVSLTTYTDFGQNMGRYVTGSRVNALLSAIREQEGGVVITYLEGHDDYTLKHCMPSFESTGDIGAYAAIGYNYIATVQHNGVQNPTFTERYIGGGNSLHYIGIEYRYSNMFLCTPDTDYKITRLSKVITDVQTSAVYTGTVPSDTLIYRAGAGTMSVRNTDGSSHGIYDAYQYITGAIARTGDMNVAGTSGVGRGLTTNFNYREAGINDLNPIPFNGDGGDSGSPLWVWNEETGAYEYLMAAQAVNGSLTDTYSKGAPEWSVEVMDSYSRNVTMGEGTGTVRIGVVTTQGETLMDSYGVAEQWSGVVTNAAGEAITTFQGVRSGINTWMSLTPEVDKDNWYAYGEAYLNAADAVSETKALSKATLFCTQNLVFNSSQAQNSIEIADAGVDLGVGYARFSRAEGAGGTVHYSISGGMFNHAGYVVDEGVAVHLTEANTDAAYVREWRKVGEGDLYIEGAGDNHVVLNVGGAGSVFLNESGANAYAAYNVLANTGATVVLQGGVNQIARDFTFGNGGGRLDFCGHSMTWDNSAANVSADGFTIHALTEEAVITNSSATDVTLTVVNPETVYLGSFQDQKDAGALNVVYTGTGKWTLNTIATNLSNSGKSSFTVQQGSVELAGSNTMHAMGSIDGRSTRRLVNAEDWHYADMAADVLVEGGTFILGSHARLTGDVTLGQNASLIIHEGVLHEYEYIEGGQRLEDTTSDFYRQFYGLKGDIKTAEGSMVLISFDNATTAEQVYGGSITGGGDLLVSLGGSGATLRLTGESSIAGSKELLSGGLISDNGVAALGFAADNAHAWHLNNNAYIAAKGSTGDELLELVRRDSVGALVLTQAQETDLKLGEKGYNGLIVGALEGLDVHYGTAGAQLSTVQNGDKAQWLLGGGGGNLIVDFALQDGTAELVLGNEYTTGNVTLTNASNKIGTISFMGQVMTLSYTDEAALGGAIVDLNYTNRMQLLSTSGMGGISSTSAGVVLVDKLDGAPLDMTGHPELYIGTGTAKQLDAAPVIAAGAGAAYRFGGIDGTLTVNDVLANAGGQPTRLIVDGQTFSGGVLELAQAATITGAVEVRGYNEGKMLETMPRRGDITLRLSAGDAIASASTVSLEDGGIIDINGTAQTFHNMGMAQGSLLTDGSAARGGRVLLDVESGRTSILAGILDVAALTKTGQGNLQLSGSNYCGTFTIGAGTVTLGGSSALSSVGTTVINQGGALNAASTALNHTILLNGGNLVVGDNNVAGSLAVAEGGSGTVTQQGDATTISSFIKVGREGTLELRGSEYTLTNEAVNTAVDAGTISVLANKLNINNSEVADIGGTLSFDSASTQTLSSDRSGDNTTRNIAHLHIGGGINKELRLDEVTWNTIWNIGKLTGGGKLVWDSDTTHWFATRVILNGDNDFSGSIIANRKDAEGSVRPYASHLELASDGAAKAAHVELSGANGTEYMGLAINTENASMLSLKGNAYTVLYAAPSMTGIGRQQGEGTDTPGGLNVKPVSTRKATLSITGDANAIFSGDVQGGENGNGLSIAKTGGGTQTFDGGTVVFNDVSALGGTLNLNSDGLTVNGNISLSRGAALTMSTAYTLGSGKLLTVGGLAADDSARFGAALTLDGGAISFSGGVLNSSTAALSLNSMSGNSVTIDFTETSALQAGTYYLANGNWTGVNVAGTALPYMDVTFQKESGSLMATFALKSGSHVWAGTPDSHTWSGDNFDPQGVSFGATDSAVFTDAASGKEVVIASSRSIGSLIFDSSQQYTVGTNGSYTVTATTLQQLGRGTTVVNGGISATDIQVQAGELLVRDAALLEGAVSISGTGTLGIDVASTVSLNGKLSAADPLGALHILSGSTYTSNSQLNAGRVLVDGGATFQLQANQSANVETGNGTTVALGGSTLSGSLTLAGDTLVTSSGGTLAADVHMDGHLLTTSGNMTINNPSLAGRLRVDSGTLTLDGGNYGNLNDITIGTGGTIYLTYGNNITNGVHMAMENGSVLSSVAGSGTSRLNIDVLGGTAEIQGCLHGNNLNVAGTISGNGTLKLGYNQANRWTVSSTIADGTGEGDTLAVTVESYVTVSGHNTYSGGTTLIDRELTVNSADALGTGGLTVNGGTLVINNGLHVASVSGTGGTIRLDNGSVLTITGNADATYAGSLANGAKLLMQGTGNQAFTTAASYGNVDVQSGTLSLNASALSGSVSVAEGAELRLSADSPTSLTSFIVNNGSIRFTGNNPVLKLAADGPFVVEGMGYRDIDGVETPDGNGFAMRGSVRVVNMGENASISGSTATVVCQGVEFDLASDGVAWLGQKSTHSYTVRHGKVTYDETFISKAGSIDVAGFILASTEEEPLAELELVENLPQYATVRTTGGGGILRLGEGVVLDAAYLQADAGVTLAGAGTVVVNDGVTLGAGSGITVGTGTTLKVSSGDVAKELMMGTNVTNNGIFEIAGDVTLDNGVSTKMTGTLKVDSGVTLTLSTAKGSQTSLGSFSSVILAGGNLWSKAAMQTVNNVSAIENSRISFADYPDNYSDVLTTFAGNTNIENGKTLTIYTEFKSNLKISHLTGAGTLDMTTASRNDHGEFMEIGSLEGFTGNISLAPGNANNPVRVTAALGNADVSMGTLSLNGNPGTASADKHTFFKLTSEHNLTLKGIDGTNGEVSLDVPTLTLDTDSNHSYTGSLAIGGALVKTGSGTQTISGYTMHKAITVQGGTLVLNGDYAIDGLANDPGTVTTYRDADGNDTTTEEYGFRAQQGYRTVYIETESGTLTLAEGARFTLEGQTATLENGKYKLPSAPDYTTLWVKGETALNYDAYYAASGNALTTAKVAGGATLRIGTNAVGTLAFQENGSTINLSGIGTVNAISGTGTLNLVDGTVTLGYNPEIEAGQTLTTIGEGTIEVESIASTGGAVSIGSKLVTTKTGDRKKGVIITDSNGSITLNGDANIAGAIYLPTGTLVIGDGSKSVRVEATKLEVGDTSSSNQSTLTVNANATLHITKADIAGDYNNTGMILGEWNGTTTANIRGSLYAENTTAYVGDTKVIYNIESGGVMAVKGIGLCQSKGDKSEIINLHLKDGGKLVLGANGISSDKEFSADFGHAEVGMTADTTLDKDITLTSAQGTTFNTTKYEWTTDEEDLVQLSDGSTGGTMTVSGNLSGTGKLIADGAGTLVLSGANTHTGGTVVNGGTLKAASAGALGNGDVTVNGGTLELTTTTAVTGALTLGNNSTLVFAGADMLTAGSLALAEDVTNLTFNLNSIVPTTVGTITLATSTNGAADLSGVDVTLVWDTKPTYYKTDGVKQVGGSWVITLENEGRELIWNGSEGTWSREAAMWHTATEPGQDVSFNSGDSAIFEASVDPAYAMLAEAVEAEKVMVQSGATVAIMASIGAEAGSLTATKMEVAGDLSTSANVTATEIVGNGTGATWNIGTGTAVTVGTLTAGEGATLTFFGSGTLTAGTITGEGTIAFGEGFQPDVTTITVAAGKELALSGAVEKTMAMANLSLEGTLVLENGYHLIITDTLPTGTASLNIRNNAALTVSLSNADNILNMDAGSSGDLYLNSGYISYRSVLGTQTLHMANGTQLWFGAKPGTDADAAVFTNDIVLDGNATVHVYGSSHHRSATISGDVNGEGHTLTKADGNQVLAFTGAVTLGGLTTANDGGGTIQFAGGEGTVGNILTHGATKIQFSAGSDSAAKNEYSFNTFSMSVDNTDNTRWLVVDKDVLVKGTGNSLSESSTIQSAWGVNGGGLEVNGTLQLAGKIGFDGPGASTIKGSGLIETTGLNISNGTTTTIQGGVVIDITSDAGVYKRDGASSTLNLANTTLKATSVNWEMKNDGHAVNAVNLTDASTGTTFDAAKDYTITLSKAMGGAGKLVKKGDGVVQVKGANSYSGGTVVNAGILEVSGSGSLGSGAVTVAQGATLKYDRSAETTVANALSGEGTLQHTGNGTTTFTGNVSGFTGSVEVEAGTLNIMNIAQAASLNVKDVTIAANATMGVYKGTEPTVGSTTEGTLTMKNGNTLKAGGANATLNANVELATGSTLDVSATGGTGLHLGSTLTINPGMKLSDADMRNVWNLEIGQTYNLMYGETFNELAIKDSSGTVTVTYNPGELTAADKLDAHTFYNDLQENHYYVVFTNNGGNVGTYAIFCNVPEPTTGTLSLLALCALAARRRKR